MKCYVPYCTNNNQGINSGFSHQRSYHIIPKRNAVVTEKWLRAIRRQNQGNYVNQRVCSDHFHTSDYYVAGNTRLLKKGVVPSIFSWPEMSVEKEKASRNAFFKVEQVEGDNAPRNVLDIQQIKEENLEENTPRNVLEIQQVKIENTLLKMEDVEENALTNALLEMRQIKEENTSDSAFEIQQVDEKSALKMEDVEENALTNALLEMRQIKEENTSDSAFEIQQVDEKSALLKMQYVEENGARNALLKVPQQSIEKQLNLSEALEEAVCLNSENDKLKRELCEMRLEAEKMQVELKQCTENMLLKTRKLNTLRRALRRKHIRHIYSISMVKNNDNSMLYYTGIPKYGVFLLLLKILLPSSEASSRFTIFVRDGLRKINRSTLTVEDQLFMVLMMLRRGIGVKMASDMFGVSKSIGQRIFNSWIDHMYVTLGSQNVWPHRDILIDNASNEFKEHYPNVVGSIDCTEFFVHKPSSLIVQSQCYSNCKSHTTLKSLIMTDPNGCIIYCSPLMTGSMSDKEIVVAGGFLNTIKRKVAAGELLPGDTILADKGLKIHDLVEGTPIEINIPTFRISGFQFTEEEVLASRKIAKETIHVERAIGILKSFKILSNAIPISLMGSINQIYIVCCLLTNFYPIRKT